MKYANEMVIDGMIHMPSFLKNNSGVGKLSGGYTFRHTQQSDLISLLVLSFRTRKVG
jgi:hypothetical protein